MPLPQLLHTLYILYWALPFVIPVAMALIFLASGVVQLWQTWCVRCLAVTDGLGLLALLLGEEDLAGSCWYEVLD